MNYGNSASCPPIRISAVLILALVVLSSFAATNDAFAVDEELTLRVQDAIGAPGGMVAVVLRTYASRPIGQGQVCLMADPIGSTTPAGVGALASLEGAVVLSSAGDVTTDVTFDGSVEPQVVLLQFASPSASVNDSDGPLAALFFRLSEDAVPGETIVLDLDTANTLLHDENGLPIQIRPRSGELLVRAPSAPHLLSVEGDEVRPGTEVTLGVQTQEPFAVSGGRIAVSYDATVAVSRPAVRMDPRHGVAGFVADTSIPGLVIVDFTSPGAVLNALPGNLIELTFRTSAAVAEGTSVTVALDPALTYLEGAEGQLLPVVFESDQLRFVGQPYKGGRRQAETLALPRDERRVDISQ